MAKKIKVMISSRCRDPIELDGKRAEYSDVRKEIKRQLEAEELFGEEVFEVWINEDAPPEEGSSDSWDTCLEQVDEADVVLVLYNGRAGWAKTPGGVGICHAEMQRALATAPAKVRLIQMPMVADPTDRDRRFQSFAGGYSLFRGAEAKSGDDALALARQALRAAVVDMVGLGKREARKGKYHLGEALDWSRLNFSERKAQIEEAILGYIEGLPGVELDGERRQAVIPVAGQPVLSAVHAVPAGLSVAAAREMVGRPFLRDHLHAEQLTDGLVGPVHIIGCHRRVTENQAVNLLGQPDVVTIDAPFGICAIDSVYHIQLILLSDCRDQTSTRHALQRFFDWLEPSGEAPLLADRAARRARILTTIAEQVE